MSTAHDHHSPAPIRLAFGITDLDVGGAERALVELVTRLDRQEWEPAVFCLGPEGALVERLAAADIPVTCLGAKRRWDVGVIGRLTRALRDWRPELLQTFLFHANIAGRFAGRRAGVPVIVNGVRVADRRGAWRHWVDRWTAGRADHHVCVSQAVADFTHDRVRIPRDRLSVIPNGVDVDRFANAPPADLAAAGIPTGHRLILFVGRLDPQKSPRDLVEAFERLADLPDVALAFVGDGPLRGELEQRARQSPLSSRIHVLGRRNDVPAVMRRASVLALPSRFEGMPNVVLEAMAAGRPVVVTDVEGVREVLRGGDFGNVVPVGDSSALAQALRRVLTDAPTAEALALTAQGYAKEHFTLDAATATYAELYRRLLNLHSDSTPPSA